MLGCSLARILKGSVTTMATECNALREWLMFAKENDWNISSTRYQKVLDVKGMFAENSTGESLSLDNGSVSPLGLNKKSFHMHDP
ncbi:hypothetical protein TIFTF001_014851 [Ficus carica]|uniref:Uncharacterized protein n=1 Tax=Ficus carica TaxID=3494 RepID=A0AA88A076_FICCA|nr:hypothetical protein TIFTF001_014851 [Ficus carica]